MNVGFRQRWQRRILWIVFGVSVLWAVSWAAVPALIQWQLEKQGSQKLGRVVTVEQVVFRPWTMRLLVRGLRVASAEKTVGALAPLHPPQLSVDEVEIDVSLQSLIFWAPVADALLVRNPQLQLTHLGQGRFDIDDVLAVLVASQSQSSGLSRFSLFNILIVGGGVQFRDAPRSVTHTLSDLHLSIPFLSNIGGRREVAIHPRLAFQFNGSAFDTDAQTTPFASDRHTQAQLQVKGFDVKPYLPYWPAAWPVRLADGQLEMDIHLDFRQQTVPELSVSGHLVLQNLQLHETGNTTELPLLPLLQLGRMDLKIDALRSLEGVFQLDTLSLDKPVLTLRRDPQGELNWVRLQRFFMPQAPLAQAPASMAAEFVLKRFQINAGQFQWLDAAVAMPASLALTDLAIQGQDFSWPNQQLASWRGQALFQGANVSWVGTTDLSSASTSMTWRDVPLLSAAPYWAELFRPGLSGKSSGQLNLDWRAPAGDMPASLLLKAPQIRMTEVLLGTLGQPEAGWAELVLDQVEVAFFTQQARVGRVTLSRPLLNASRNPQGRWMVDDWRVKTPSGPLHDAKGKPWQLAMGPIQIHGGVLNLADRFVPNGAKLNVQDLNLRVGADLNYSGGLNLVMSDAGLALDLQGNLSFDKLRALDRSEGETLLDTQALSLRGLELKVDGGALKRLKIAETMLSDFFARVAIDDQGQLNFHKLIKATSSAASQSPDVPALIELGPIGVYKGRVLFSDHFIRPHYVANITELAGSLGAVSSPERGAVPALADLTLRGRVAGSGALDVSGRINPLARPAALEVRGRVRDLELPQLSPYSRKYAGYGIERGQLSADVHYQIAASGQLEAKHQIVLNQLRFGEHSASLDAPNLPVKLAVALLADRNGVIDINLPISGSINDPDFRVGSIIWKMVLGLIGKAVTAPFSLISGAFASEEPLQQINFAPGRAELDDEAQQKLKTLALLLLEKPALRLTIVGEAHLDTEREAMLMAAIQVDESVIRELAQARASHVRSALLALNVPASQLFLGAPVLSATLAPRVTWLVSSD